MNTDLELINATLSGDRSAFGKLALRYQTRVYRLAYRIISNPFDASDIVQETLLKAYQNLGQLKNRDKFSAWLLQIAKNQCVSWIRKYQRNLMAVEDEMVSNQLHLPPAPDEILIKRELHERVMRAVSKLPEYNRRAVEMFYFEGKSYSEIQSELGITKGTLGRCLYKAKAELRKKLREAYQIALISTTRGLKRALRLTPGQTATATNAAVVSGAKCLVISVMLHVLIFTGMSITGARWGISGGTGAVSGYGSAMEISLVEAHPPRPRVRLRHLPPVEAIPRRSRVAEITTAKSMVLELPPSKRQRLKITQPVSEGSIQELNMAPVVDMFHIKPPLDHVAAGVEPIILNVASPLKRIQDTLMHNISPPARNGNELVALDDAVQPVEAPFEAHEPLPDILFVSSQGNRYRREICVMNLDGTRIMQIGSDDLISNLGGVSVSPDRRRIAFHARARAVSGSIGLSRDCYICVMDMNSKDYTFLTYGLCPAWSPDVRKIAFCRREGWNTEMYVMNADGSDPVAVGRNQSTNLRPAWSPDGTRIAFSSNMKTDRRTRNIYAMDADGKNQRKLTYTSTVGWWNDYPAWSPDGTRIAYASGKTNRRGLTRSREGYIQSTIFIMDVETGTRRALVTRAYCPAWSPDGQKIVFCSNRDGNEEIYMIDIDGRNLKRLTENHHIDTEPLWLPAEPLD